jgi:hypothetical protein
LVKLSIALGGSLCWLLAHPASAGLVGPDNAWFTLEGGDCPAVSVLSSGPGQTLVIEKGAAPSCILQLGYRQTATLNAVPTTLESWSLTLPGGDPDLTVPSPGGLGLDWLGTGYTIFFGTPGGNGELLFNFGERSTNGSGSTGLVGLINLVVTKDGLPDVHDIFGRIGPVGSRVSNGDFWFGSVGPNPPITAAPDTSFGLLPVVTLRNVPEPAVAAGLLPVIFASTRPRGRAYAFAGGSSPSARASRARAATCS